MPTQIFIIPPKAPRARKPLGASISDTVQKPESQSEPHTPIGDQTKSSSENKLAPPSIRISPPQLILDSLSDWEDEDRRFGRRLTLIPRQHRKYKEPLPRIQEDEPQHAAVSAIVSAPIVELPAALISSNTVDHASTDSTETHGQTLLHLAAKLGHEDIMRMLVNETSQANILLNSRGQTPLLCAIESGSTSTATLLMEQDPLSLTCKDNIGSSVFHYATEHCNDIVLSRAISLLKRLSSSTARLTALQRLVEKNTNGKTPFVIAIEKGSLKCIKYILGSKWLHRTVDIGDFINSDSLKTTIDKDQVDIAAFFVSDTQRFAAIIQIKINCNGRVYNVLEYSIALKKPDFVRIFISVKIPGDERELYRSYKYFLRHYNVAYSGSSYDQTPIQRMLTMVNILVK
jgi:ankyrin repeat protein